ncbi:MAG: type II toxin-antitoxin system VapC family toxin [Candidatus Brockarchaeota archaeon]|nr:type II toxin-antitoxin system VapC family toxin [Candidatus Brockarchaeota archaeon]MBO3767768.1 type II toxin-antitoxin system VapC family toxin [Candidatus Brockarchaeota archaeon]
MKYLLDASALLPLVTRRGRQLLLEATRADLIITDLAIYEACNSLWKLSTLLKSISIEDAIDTATIIKDLATRGMIKPIKFTKLDFSNTLQIAYKEGITFYDASYIATARNAEATLVTEDEKLKKAASKFIKTITYSDLESKLTQTNGQK